MKAKALIILFFISVSCYSQTKVGIGIYPTGSETGLGFRLNKDKKINFETRISKANFSNSPSLSQFINETSVLWRLVLLEKVRFHMGIGFRGEFNLIATSKFGGVLPIGIEAFPFPFQNAGLFFEAAPFYTINHENQWSSGIRTVAGFVFYFPQKNTKQHG